jgi:ribosomal peptide maturation radical SAM protein 1
MHALLIVPPFASIHRPAIGVHVLQSVAAARGLQVEILYANLIFAALLGEAEHEAICEHWFMDFMGERIMGAFAFPGRMALPALPARFTQGAAQLQHAVDAWLAQVRKQVQAFAGEPEREDVPTVAHEPVCIGISSTFDQTNAALMLARLCRQSCPQARIVIGGANCEDAMASGMAQHIAEADHIFAGDSEVVFCDFLANPDAFAGQKIIRCPPNEAINQLPANDYRPWLQQLARCLPDSALRQHFELPYESSRGCWWGQKHHCTFCGLNGQGMGFREKSADKVYDELMALQTGLGAKHVVMTDNIMPHGFFTTLLPRLAAAESKLDIFYEQKANIDLAKAILLQQAGISRIQPGIEGLHTESLKLMKKGVRAKQNIALLRYARALSIDVTWNLLYGFPGEQEAWFAEVLQHLPKLGHLQPPSGMAAINLDRFSPMFNTPEKFGFTNLRPHPAYAGIFPNHPDIAQMAYHFCADSITPTFADSALLAPFQAALKDWQQGWWRGGTSPRLLILEMSADQYLLLDSRSLHGHCPGQTRSQTITRRQAAACLVELPNTTLDTDWALQQQTAIRFDGVHLPLAIAEAQLMLRFEREYGDPGRQASLMEATMPETDPPPRRVQLPVKWRRSERAIQNKS